MLVTSCLPDTSGRHFLVPERYRQSGVLGELADQGEACTPVPVPCSEHALRAWSDDAQTTLEAVRERVATYVEVLEVRSSRVLHAVLRCGHALQHAKPCCMQVWNGEVLSRACVTSFSAAGVPNKACLDLLCRRRLCDSRDAQSSSHRRKRSPCVSAFRSATS